MSALNHLEHQSVQQAAAAAGLQEYLSFRLGDEEYGIDILRVQEIRSYEAPTRIAGAPAEVLGVLNLRGVIVPIADLRVRFGCEARFDTATVIVVLNIGGCVTGAVVDSVSDVVGLSPSQILPTPGFSNAVDASHITGIAELRAGEQDRLLILLDIERLMRIVSPAAEECLA